MHHKLGAQGQARVGTESMRPRSVGRYPASSKRVAPPSTAILTDLNSGCRAQRGRSRGGGSKDHHEPRACPRSACAAPHANSPRGAAHLEPHVRQGVDARPRYARRTVFALGHRRQQRFPRSAACHWADDLVAQVEGSRPRAGTVSTRSDARKMGPAPSTERDPQPPRGAGARGSETADVLGARSPRPRLAADQLRRR